MTTRDTEELTSFLQEPDYELPVDSSIQVSTYETKWLEDLIDPLSKIVTNGRTAEEKEILEKSTVIYMDAKEMAEEKSRILTEFPKVQWNKEPKQKNPEKVKVYTTPLETSSVCHKTESQDKLDTPQQQELPPNRRWTQVHLIGNSRNMSKTESVILELDKSISEKVLDPMTPLQAINMNTGPQNESSLPKSSPDMQSALPNPPGPPIFSEAFVASQHGYRVIEALPYFPDELVPLTLSGQQERLMGIGLEQDSDTAFAEFALADVQLILNLDNELLSFEGEAYIMLQ